MINKVLDTLRINRTLLNIAYKPNEIKPSEYEKTLKKLKTNKVVSRGARINTHCASAVTFDFHQRIEIYSHISLNLRKPASGFDLLP